MDKAAFNHQHSFTFSTQCYYTVHMSIYSIDVNSVQYYCYDDGAALKILSKVYETKTPSPNWDSIYAHGPNYDNGN